MCHGRTLTEAALSPAVSAAVGTALGQLHRALAGFVPAGHKARADLPWLAAEVARAGDLLRAHGAQAEAARLAADWTAAGAGAAFDALPQGVVHADLYPANVVYARGRLVGFIDFDDAYYGTLLHDVAIAAMEFGTGPDAVPDPALVAPLVAAYAALRGPVAAGDLVRAMWLNGFRFYGDALAITLRDGGTPADNLYARRLDYYRDAARRARLVAALERSSVTA